MQHTFRLAGLAAILAALAACEPYPTEMTDLPPLPMGPLEAPGYPSEPPPDYTGPAAPVGGFEAAPLDPGSPVSTATIGDPVTAVEPSDCGASSRQAYVGRPANEAEGIPSSGSKRILAPGESAGTPDPTRLTVQLRDSVDEEEGEVIDRIYCG